MGLRDIINNTFGSRPLRALIVGGLAGVLLDVDHFIAAAIFNVAKIPELARFLHFPAAVDSLLVLCGVGACVVGLYGYWAVVFILTGEKKWKNQIGER